MRAPSPGTRPRASAPRWCAAPAARRVRSSTRRSTPPRCAPTCRRCARRSSGPASTPSGTHELYLLGYRDSGMPDTEANARARQFRQRPARRGGRAPGRGDPAGAAAGAHHLRRRERVLPAPRPPPGARDLRSPRSTRPATPTATRRPVSRGSRRSCTTPGSRSGASAPCTRLTRQLGEESPYAERIGAVAHRRRDHAPDHLRRRGRLPRRAPRRAARAPHADRSREPLDAGARRPPAEHVPVGGVRVGPIARRGPTEEPESDLFAGVRAPTDVARGAEVRA